jgi:hypothetical protein
MGLFEEIKAFLDLMDNTNNENEGRSANFLCKGYDILCKFEEMMGG